MPYTYDFYLKFFLKEKFDPKSADLLKDPAELALLNIKIYHWLYIRMIYTFYGKDIFLYILYNWGFQFKDLN